MENKKEAFEALKLIDRYIDITRERRRYEDRLLESTQIEDDLANEIKEKKLFLFDALLEEPEEAPCYLYYFYDKERNLVKIGISHNPSKRLKSLEGATGETLEEIGCIRFDSRAEALECESYLHKEYEAYRKRPLHSSSEWFHGVIREHLRGVYGTKEDIKNGMAYKNKIMLEELNKIKFGV